MNDKPLGFKNYGSIGHLPCSRMGPGDHAVPVGVANICLERVRDRHDKVFVTEKLDGSNVGVANIGGQLVALGRSGYRAETSKYEQHQLFADWVKENTERFLPWLTPGLRCVGEWLAQAHGTRYTLRHEPLVIFDILEGQKRWSWDAAEELISRAGFIAPTPLGSEPTTVEVALARADLFSRHGADEIEGAVWRVERKGQFDFMAKFVKPSKVDGCLLPELSGGDPIWNWRPTHEMHTL